MWCDWQSRHTGHDPPPVNQVVSVGVARLPFHYVRLGRFIGQRNCWYLRCGTTATHTHIRMLVSTVRETDRYMQFVVDVVRVWVWPVELCRERKKKLKRGE